MTKQAMENRMNIMKYILTALLLFTGAVQAQQSIVRLPRDANNTPLDFGLGIPYAFTLTATADAYDTGVRYELPKTGNDLNRAYRHLLVYNPDATRTVYACFGDATGCSIDSYIVPPGFGFIFEPIRFGDAVGLPYVYIRLDAAGSVTPTMTAW